ncbi:DUF2461 domain-containing protein [Neptunitalea lumnitzerae]|uniref:TIGR02453 family protein n=1 Tax=Neptunitalea lumnitzerae TaxID=2965509 RepID=A0ABQ5MJS5_9FLAO|nr:DUF2461 domain-containing protein [Neptunitalea sp. Y10]GLB49644.1 TIGR02453 family protein [Neptunitalea sp. Y10]
MITIPNELFEFLEELKENNNREWFADNKKRFKDLEKKVKLFNEEVLANLKTHDEVDSLKMFRIYRDVRFSKNKAPYKINLGCSFHRIKPRLRGGYYVHLEPNNSFLACGFWAPEKDDLMRIRKELEMDAEEFKEVINLDEIKNVWGAIEGEELKTAPKGFDKTHADIALIRKKQYVFTKKLTNKEVVSNNFLHLVSDSFKAIRPFFDLMSDILTTDLNGESILSDS